MMRWILFFGLLPLSLAAHLPVSLTAKGGMRLNERTHTVHAFQGVEVIRGEVTLYANDAFLTYTNASKGQREILSVRAEGTPMRIVMPEATLWAMKGLFNMPQDTLTLTGDNLCLQAKKGTLVAQDRLIYRPQARYVEAHGSVHVTNVDGSHQLQANHLYAHLRDGTALSQDGQAIESMQAEGSVRITAPHIKASGKKGTYTAAKEEFTLEGNVKVWKDDQYLEGEKLVIDRKRGISYFTAEKQKPIKALFIPSSSKK